MVVCVSEGRGVAARQPWARPGPRMGPERCDQARAGPARQGVWKRTVDDACDRGSPQAGPSNWPWRGVCGHARALRGNNSGHA